MNKLPNVVEDSSPFFDSTDNGRKIIVHQNHIGRFFCDVCPRDAHRDADISRLHGRSIIDSISGHGDDLTTSLQRFHNA